MARKRYSDEDVLNSELRLWAELAVKHNISIFMLHHTGKAAHVHYPDPLDHLLGSIAITATADWVLVMQKTQDGQGASLYVEGKMAKSQEFGLEKVDGIYYRIVGHAKDLAKLPPNAIRRLTVSGWLQWPVDNLYR